MSYASGNFVAIDNVLSSPGSPPGMTSSKSSSIHSFNSDEDDNSVLADGGHFEEIGLEDDVTSLDSSHLRDTQIKAAPPNPYSPAFASDLRAASGKHVGARIHANPRDLAKPRSHRDLRGSASSQKSRPAMPSLTTQFRDTSTHNLTGGISLDPHPSLQVRSLAVRSASAASFSRRRRSPSPNYPLHSLGPRDPKGLINPRRSSWQSSLERKTAIDLERECDEDDDDNIPDFLILDNVPISPRPPIERAASRPVSTSTSPERTTKERVRSVGNGTPAVATAQGSLRSPSWKSEASAEHPKSPLPSPLKGRAKSWTAALSELNAEAKALTEKLEEHADELDKNGVRYERPAPKPRVKSALAELPPLRRTNIMIDPLPVSKEKEAVLSRTRPSWLPPKDPSEEKKHLKEYQRMMASSVEAEKRREASRKERELAKDAAANSSMHIWENDVLGRWNDSIREKRTRDLWWKGVAPRSRGAVWSRAIGNDLGLNEMSFQAALTRAREAEARIAGGTATVDDERRALWFDQIQSEVEHYTWPELRIFQSGGPLHTSLIDILLAYAMYRSDIGYVSGCNTIAAILLLNLPTPTATFSALANLLNRPLPLSFLSSDPGAKASAYNLVLRNLAEKSPRLHDHLANPAHGLEPDEYIADIFTALFTRHLNLESCTRLWDVYVFEGDAILVRAAVALLQDCEAAILGTTTAAGIRTALASHVAVSTTRDDMDTWMKRIRTMARV